MGLIRLNLASLLLAIFVAGCGTAVQESVDNEKKDPVVLTGSAHLGLFFSGEVVAYPLGGDTSGNPIAKSDIDGDGKFALSIGKTKGPLQVCVVQGKYIEEASGVTIALREGQSLCGVVTADGVNSKELAITFYTHIASGLSQCLLNSGTAGEEAVKQANNRISGWLGLDIATTTPIEISLAESSTGFATDGHRYGFANAAVSGLMAYVSEQNGQPIHQENTSIHFATLAKDDISTTGCLLDGNGGEMLAMGNVSVTTQLYRSELPLNLLIMTNSYKNLTTLKVADLVSTAQTMNDSEDPIFNNEAVTQIDTQTVVANVSVKSGDVLVGEVSFGAEVADRLGVSSVEFGAVSSIGGNYSLGSASDLAKPVVAFNTRLLPDATNYTLQISVKNLIDVTRVVAVENVSISNTGIAISNIQPPDGALVRGNFTMSATVGSTLEISSVEFSDDQGNTVLAGTPAKPSVQLDSSQLADGGHQYSLTVTNVVSEKAVQSVDYVVDNTAPTLVIDKPANGAFLSGSAVPFRANAEDVYGMQSATLDFTGARTTFVDFPALQSSLNVAGIEDGPYVLVLAGIDKAGNSASTKLDLVVDNTAPAVTIDNLVAGAFRRGKFSVKSTVSDANGVVSVDFYLDDVRIGSAADVTNPALDIVSTNYLEGLHKIGVVATDVAGNTASVSVNNIMFDNTAPNVSLSASTTAAGGWYCNMTIGFSDPGDALVARSGIASASMSHISLNPNPTVYAVGPDAGSKVQLINISNTQTVSVSATDRAGNVTSKSYSVNLPFEGGVCSVL